MGRGCFCGCSNAVVGVLNAGIMAISLMVLGLWAWKAGGDLSTVCDQFLQAPLLLLGASLFAVSLLGIIGACCRASCILWLYLAVTFFLILAVSCFTALAFVVTNKGAAAAVSGHGVGEFRLGDYSGWLRRMVTHAGHWEKIESCLKDAKVCGGPLHALPLDPSAFYKTTLSPTQSGCCNPPAGCHRKGRQFPVLSDDGDCERWRNEPERLCFGCNSCKAGVLANLQAEWKFLAIFNLGLLALLVLVYSVGCCAVRSGRRDSYKRYWRSQRPT
ncbi:unnamed protein product [Spirodela intermedia]|uniref:Uncharacterized protein n=1 Tax=Spirodela intermedia TaxID=51605 RepID=A0A7I8LCK1_SPIIN|nr:unnamed protein product [Spirodela intermedia]